MPDEPRRRLPAIEKLLHEEQIIGLEGQVPRSVILKAARETVDDLRARIKDGEPLDQDAVSAEHIAARIRDLALRMNEPSLKNVINATGVVLHTGLGRAVLPQAARDALARIASGHSNLELDLESGGRGSRRTHYADLLADITGAEAAFAVNNNAAAVLLALNTIARGREVIISRGQLVEIGGSFRLPDIMSRASVRLVEVGTTNRTRISDYEKAISEETALILRVHPSNFRLVGYAQEASLEELVALGGRHGIPVMDDVGSGALVDLGRFGLTGDPLVQESVRAGADIVAFSGDKLLGGPQAGLIVGKQNVVADLASNPLARALRLDKLTIAALEGTLKLYADPDSVMERIPTLRAIARPLDDINRDALRLRRLLRASIPGAIEVEVTDGLSEVGGGSLPGQTLPTKLVAISPQGGKFTNANDIAASFRRADPPILGRVGDDRFLLDLRTVETSDLQAIVHAARQIFRG